MTNESTKERVAAAAREAWKHRLPIATRAARALVASFTSTTFAIGVLGPFAGWAAVLYWARDRFDFGIAQAVAFGPAPAVQIWIVIASAVLCFALVLGRYRQVLSMGMAIATLFALQILFFVPTATRTARAAHHTGTGPTGAQALEQPSP